MLVTLLTLSKVNFSRAGYYRDIISLSLYDYVLSESGHLYIMIFITLALSFPGFKRLYSNKAM